MSIHEKYYPILILAFNALEKKVFEAVYDDREQKIICTKSEHEKAQFTVEHFFINTDGKYTKLILKNDVYNVIHLLENVSDVKIIESLFMLINDFLQEKKELIDDTCKEIDSILFN